MRRPAAPASSGAAPWAPTTGTPPSRWQPASPWRSSSASGWCWRSLSRPSRLPRTVQRAECSSNHGRRFLANLWQTALRARGEDALCLVELRGFEPLTPCMPYTDRRPHHRRLQLTSCRFGCPLGTVIDREYPLFRGPTTDPAGIPVALLASEETVGAGRIRSRHDAVREQGRRGAQVLDGTLWSLRRPDRCQQARPLPVGDHARRPRS